MSTINKKILRSEPSKERITIIDVLETMSFLSLIGGIFMAFVIVPEKGLPGFQSLTWAIAGIILCVIFVASAKKIAVLTKIELNTRKDSTIQ